MMTTSESERALEYPLRATEALEPPAEWAELRQQCPVAPVRLPSGDEATLLTRYDDVRQVLADPRFSRQLTDDGAIVNITSGAAFGGEPTRPAYAASKAGVNTLTRHVASRWGKQGVRCNAVSPGLVLSETARRTLSHDFLDGMLAATRSPRLGEAADVAATASFLLSEDATWINGQVWTVDGGALLRQ